MGRLDGKTAIVTGSNQNIGRAIVELFAEEGANVVVNGHSSKEKVDDTVATIRRAGGNAIGIMADVSEPDQVGALVSEAKKCFGRVDIAVSNVGIRHKMPFEEISVDGWNRVINSNLSSAFYMAHHVVPSMREQAWGRIIHISGYDGFTGHVPHRAANVTAKAGMHALAKAIAREYGKHNITANTIVVGAIETTRAANQHVSEALIRRALQGLALGSFGEPRDIAEACLFLAGESGKFITGQAIHVNGGEYMF